MTSWSRSRDRVTLRSRASLNASTLLSLRALAAERPAEPVRALPARRLAPDFEPLDLPDLEPPDLVAIESPPWCRRY
jgi:hypothetical protein